MTISNWERGKGKPDDDSLKRLIKLFGPIGEEGTAVEEDSFGAWLRRELKQRDMTLQQLSDATGVSIATISLIQTGKIQRPQRRTIDRIEAVLKKGARKNDQAPMEAPPELSEVAGVNLPIGEWQEIAIEDEGSWPSTAGVYILYDIARRLTYVGKSQNIRSRLREHEEKKWWVKGRTVVTAAYIEVKDPKLRSRLEELLITFANGNILVNKNLVDRD